MDGKQLYVKNRNGRILWTKPINFNTYQLDFPKDIARSIRIVDTNDDKENEILICYGSFKEQEEGVSNKIFCFSSSGDLMWGYKFNDTLSSNREKLSNDYNHLLIDTVTYKNTKCLLAIANNDFQSVLFRA